MFPFPAYYIWDNRNNIASKRKTQIYSWNEFMTEPVFVSSVQDFVAKITKEMIKRIDRLDTNVSSWTLYRGQSDSTWLLNPSLFREGLVHKERTLISELRRVRPEEFDGLTDFDALVKMQHYGLPTRLLDMTHNPLVALYFACEGIESSEKDGSVYAFRNMPIFWQENYAVRILIRYAFKFSGSGINLESFLSNMLQDPIIASKVVDSGRFRETAMHYLTKVPALAVRPSLSNLRIAKQDGAFLLFGMKLKKVVPETGTTNSYLEFSTHPGDETGERLWPHTIEYRIPSEKKKQFLLELEVLGITRGRLFPELQYQAEFVKEFVSREPAYDKMKGQ